LDSIASEGAGCRAEEMKGNQVMQEFARIKSSQAAMMLLFTVLSALSATATAVVPIFIHA